MEELQDINLKIEECDRNMEYWDKLKAELVGDFDLCEYAKKYIKKYTEMKERYELEKGYLKRKMKRNKFIVI